MALTTSHQSPSAPRRLEFQNPDTPHGNSAPPWPADAHPDALVGAWSIWQRRGGHRTSTDDLLTAWLAVELMRAHPNQTPQTPTNYLDLGCGIGSVLLMTTYALRPLRTVGVEAQEVSAQMALRSVNELPDPPPIEIWWGDLRDIDPQALGAPFDLITGSPPYLPPGTGVLSPDPQRAACRFELRGGVEEYCQAAARCLSDQGRFSLVFQTVWAPRVIQAGTAAGLHLIAQADIRTRADNAESFLSVFGFARQPASHIQRFELAVRDAQGQITPEYLQLRQTLGLGH